MGFSRQEYWSGLPCPPPGGSSQPVSFASPALAGRLLTTSATWGDICNVFVWLCHVFIAERAFLQWEKSRLFLLQWAEATLCRLVHASHCGGFSCCRAQTPERGVFSSCSSQGLAHKLSSCGAQPYVLLGMWDLPGSGIKPVSPALAGGFFNTESPGKPRGHSWRTNVVIKWITKINSWTVNVHIYFWKLLGIVS